MLVVATVLVPALVSQVVARPVFGVAPSQLSKRGETGLETREFERPTHGASFLGFPVQNGGGDDDDNSSAPVKFHGHQGEDDEENEDDEEGQGGEDEDEEEGSNGGEDEENEDGDDEGNSNGFPGFPGSSDGEDEEDEEGGAPGFPGAPQGDDEEEGGNTVPRPRPGQGQGEEDDNETGSGEDDDENNGGSGNGGEDEDEGSGNGEDEEGGNGGGGDEDNSGSGDEEDGGSGDGEEDEGGNGEGEDDEGGSGEDDEGGSGDDDTPVPTGAPAPGAPIPSAPAPAPAPIPTGAPSAPGAPPAPAPPAPAPTGAPSPGAPAPAPPAPAPGTTGPVQNLPANAKADYQIGGPYTPASDVQVVTRDHTADPASGLYNICYINAFQSQPDDASFWQADGRDALLLSSGNGFFEDPDWPGEFFLDTSTEEKRNGLAAVVNSWIDECAQKGFNAIEFDNLDTFSRSNNLLTKENNLAFAKILVDHAHSLGLAAAQKNTGEELGSSGKSVAGFDFAVAEECQHYNECNFYTDVYGAQVIEIEYTDSDSGASDFQNACDSQGKSISVILRDRNVAPGGSGDYSYQEC